VISRIGFRIVVLFGLLVGGTAAANVSEWEVEGLPAALDSVSRLELPHDAAEAASVLLHVLENAGYPLAEVRIRDKRLIVTFGRIVDVRVEGLRDSSADLARRYLETVRGMSPTADQWSHLVALINDMPGAEASVGIYRLDDHGNYGVVVEGSERRQSGALSVRNTPTEDLSEKTASLHQEFYALAAGGDVLRIEAVYTDAASGSDAYFGEVSYQRPVDADGAFAEVRVSHFEATSDAKFQPESSDDSEMTGVALVLGKAFSRFVGFSRDGYIELDYRAEDQGLQGRFDYGVARVSWFEDRHDSFGNSFSYGLTFSGGTEVSGAGEAFTSLRAGAGFIGWLPMISDSAEFRIESSGQIGTSGLPGFELFSFDGANRQRGFSPFEYSGNHGLDINLELADTFHPWGPAAPRFSPYAFVDASYLNNRSSEGSQDRPSHNELVSAGVGTRFTLSSGFSVNSWVAVPVHDGQRSGRARAPEFYLQGQLTW